MSHSPAGSTGLPETRHPGAGGPSSVSGGSNAGSGELRIRDITIRYGKGPGTHIDQIPPDEVFSEAQICIAGHLAGRFGEGMSLTLEHTPRGRASYLTPITPEKGKFSSSLTLRNGANDLRFRVLGPDQGLVTENAFTLFYKSSFREWNETVFIAFILALIIRSLVLQAFWIPTGSMEPTLLGEKRNGRGELERQGDRILVNKFAYVADLTLDGRLPFLPRIWFTMPRRGDIVVFKYPDKNPLNPPRDFIKRVIGLPGERIRITDGKVYVNDQPLTEPYIAEEPWAPFETTVPDDSLFVMGDNRNNSADSRYWGPMPLANLKGQAVFLYWPLLDQKKNRRFSPIRSYLHSPPTEAVSDQAPAAAP